MRLVWILDLKKPASFRFEKREILLYLYSFLTVVTSFLDKFIAVKYNFNPYGFYCICDLLSSISRIAFFNYIETSLLPLKGCMRGQCLANETPRRLWNISETRFIFTHQTLSSTCMIFCLFEMMHLLEEVKV